MSALYDQITAKALEVLGQRPEGIGYTELCRIVTAAGNGEWKESTVGTYLGDFLYRELPETVTRTSKKGRFLLVKFAAEVPGATVGAAPSVLPDGLAERDFYEPFAKWLLDQGECTKAIPLGRSKFRDKWGTPDVLGKRESRKSDLVPGALEIVAAEIKPDTYQLVTAFGQACSYCLFSHRSYLVVPEQTPEPEQERLDSLCQVFGIGLVFFDATNAAQPNFTSRLRPRRQEPDLFYTNVYMKLVEDELFV